MKQDLNVKQLNGVLKMINKCQKIGSLKLFRTALSGLVMVLSGCATVSGDLVKSGTVTLEVQDSTTVSFINVRVDEDNDGVMVRGHILGHGKIGTFPRGNVNIELLNESREIVQRTATSLYTGALNNRRNFDSGEFSAHIHASNLKGNIVRLSYEPAQDY